MEFLKYKIFIKCFMIILFLDVIYAINSTSINDSSLPLTSSLLTTTTSPSTTTIVSTTTTTTTEKPLNLILKNVTYLNDSLRFDWTINKNNQNLFIICKNDFGLMLNYSFNSQNLTSIEYSLQNEFHGSLIKCKIIHETSNFTSNEINVQIGMSKN